MMKSHYVLALLSFLTVFGNLEAQVPLVLNHQGRVTVGGVPFNGSGQFKFALVNGDGTQTYWQSALDTAPADGQPDTAVSLGVSKGLYSVGLGDAAVMLALDASALAHPAVRLRVWFNDGIHGFQLMAPDQALASVPYAVMARTAETAAVATTVIPGAVSQLGTPNGVDPSVVQVVNTGDVGIGTNTPSSKLEVNGTVKATAFSGDGSQLTGVAQSVILSGATDQSVGNQDFIGLGASSAGFSRNSLVITRAAVISALSFSVRDAVPNTGITATLWKQTWPNPPVATALSATIGDGLTAVFALGSDQIQVAAGDLISIRLTWATGGALSLGATWSVELR